MTMTTGQTIKRSRVDRKKEWYVAEWGRLLDENERLKKRVHELTAESVWSAFVRVFRGTRTQ